MEVKIEESWKEALAAEFVKPYFAGLVKYLHAEKAAGATVFPPGRDIFRAFELTPLDRVKVVILGQDPYHGYGQAMGLSFSVPDGVPVPPSLKNIFKEISDDLGVQMSGRPNLESWARQGVLLLNAVLTVFARLSQQDWLGDIHGRCNTLYIRQLRRSCFYALGKFRQKQAGTD